jgi:hypothetical protein
MNVRPSPEHREPLPPVAMIKVVMLCGLLLDVLAEYPEQAPPELLVALRAATECKRC